MANTPHRAARARILVAGGGPAGMETASLMAEDGHTERPVDEEVLASRDDAIVVATGAVGRDAAGLLRAGAGLRDTFDVRTWPAAGGGRTTA